MIECVTWGDFEENTYIIGDENECCIIDPGAPYDVLKKTIRNRNITAILLTHTHFDHIIGADEIRDKTGAFLYVSEKESDGLENPAVNLSALFGEKIIRRKPDKVLRGGDEIRIGKITLKVLEIPGHSKGHLAYAGDGFIVTGDALFAGSIGRTDFPGSDFSLLVKSIKTKLFTFPDNCIVYPGHGPKTTIGTERKFNPFVN